MRKLVLCVLPFLFASPCLGGNFNIICLLSEDSYYIQNMEMGFKRQMKKEGLLAGKNLTCARLPGSGGPADWSSCKDLNAAIKRSAPHLIVSFGTASSIAALQCIGPESIPLVFAGVTDPVGSGLVTSLDKPPTSLFTGVIYGMPSHILFRFIQSILPETKHLGFLYDPSFAPDEHYKSILEKADIPAGMNLAYIPIDKRLSIPAEYRHTVRVFIGWYGLYTHQETLAAKYPEAAFIGSNISQLENGALAAISPADQDIGKDAARIVADILLRKREISGIPPRQPSRFVIGINLRKARELNMDIPEKVTAIADKVIK